MTGQRQLRMDDDKAESGDQGDVCKGLLKGAAKKDIRKRKMT